MCIRDSIEAKQRQSFFEEELGEVGKVANIFREKIIENESMQNKQIFYLTLKQMNLEFICFCRSKS